MGNVVSCPSCNQQLDVGTSSAGTVVACPCGQNLTVPEFQHPSSPQIETTPIPKPTPINPPTPITPTPINPTPMGTQGSISPPTPIYPAPQPTYQSSVGPSRIHSQYGTGEPNSQPREDVMQKLGLVNLGVQLVFIGVLVALLSSFLIFLPWSFALFNLVSIIQMLAQLAVIAGYILCIFAPTKSKSLPFIIVALSCTALGGIVLKMMEFGSYYSEPDDGISTITVMVIVLPSVGTGFFLLFLRQMALFTGQKSEAEEAKNLAIMMCVLAGVGFVCGLMIPIIGLLVIFLFFALMIGHLIWLVQFIIFLNKLEFRRQARRRKPNSTSGWADARKS